MIASIGRQDVEGTYGWLSQGIIPAVAMISNQPLSVIVTFPSDNVSKIDQSATGPLVYHTQRGGNRARQETRFLSYRN